MRKAIAVFYALSFPGAATLAVAQNQPPPYPQTAQPQNGPLLSPDQLDNLVAPVALYPDPLLAQVLAAATYPLEIVEAQQWFNQNRNLQGQQLVDAAKQQNWDPSVAALVAFPDALALLGRDIQWTTDLGNAFLAQQSDVMAAVQSLRARAQQNGRLQSSPQENVSGDPGGIQIQPANPQIVYVPVYNPEYVWGAPVLGAYPALWYPPVSYGCGFGAGVFLGGLFAGFLGFGGWGWGLSWLAHGLFLNGLFFNHFGFGGFGGARTWWAHNPAHRLGVAYPNRAVASHFAGAGGGRFNGARYSARAYGGNRSYGGAERGFNGYGGGNRAGAYSRNYAGARNNFAGSSRGSIENGRNSYNSGSRNFAGNAHGAPQQQSRNYGNSNFRGSSNRNFGGGNSRAPHQSSRNFSGGGGHSSAPRSSGGGHSGGGHSGGGHSGGGHSGGGHGGGSHRR